MSRCTWLRFRIHVIAMMLVFHLFLLVVLFQHQNEIQTHFDRYYAAAVLESIAPASKIEMRQATRHQPRQQQQQQQELQQQHHNSTARRHSISKPSSLVVVRNDRFSKRTPSVAVACHDHFQNDSTIFWNQPHFQNLSPKEDERLTVDALHQSLLSLMMRRNSLPSSSSSSWNSLLLHQTLCHESSRFRNPNPPYDEDWHMRLLYFGIYLHQHLPALQEMETRRACRRRRRLNNTVNSIHHEHQQQYDPSFLNTANYQCDATTKYLFASLPQAGAGATFRNGAVPAMLAGLATGRVVLFVNERPYGKTDSMRYSWSLASSDACPRGDYQCYFLPVTPCVLTERDMQQAVERQIQLEQETNVTITLDGMIHGDIDIVKDERIVVVEAEAMPLEPNVTSERRIRRHLHDLILTHTLLAEMDHSNSSTTTTAARIDRVLEQILLLPNKEYNGRVNIQRKQQKTKLQQWQGRHGIDFQQSTSTLHHAALLYILRPNLKFRQLIEQDLNQAMPKDFDPEWSFGLPIRASDKCSAESTCLTFDQYMQLTRQQYDKSRNRTEHRRRRNHIANVILTSEAAPILSSRHNYTTSPAYPFRFVVNEKDVTQGHGQPDFFNEKGADKIMLSTVVALKMQLMAKYTVVNCCSSFHRMMLDLLRSGCGAVQDPEYQCLKEMEDEQFHVCCLWESGKKCSNIRKEFQEKYLAKPDEYGGFFEDLSASSSSGASVK